MSTGKFFDPLSQVFTTPIVGGDHGGAAPGNASGAAAPDAALVQEMRNEIRTLVQEISQLAQTEISLDDFYEGFLTRVVGAMAAVGGAIWSVAENQPPQLRSQVNLSVVGLTSETQPQHLALLKKVATGGQAVLVPPHSGLGTSGPSSEVVAASQPHNPTDLLLVLSPLLQEGKVVGIAEIFQRPGGGPTTLRGYVRFLVQMAELAAEFLKNQRLRQLVDSQQLWQQLEAFLAAIHGSLDLRETSFAVVNEGRRLIGCDRVTLALQEGSRLRVTTVSGLDSIDRRASEIQRLSQLATTVYKTKQPFWHSADAAEVAPQIDEHLQPYVDTSHSKLIAILPLVSAPAAAAETETARATTLPRYLGVLIVEQFKDDRATDSLRSRCEVVVTHSAAALANAKTHNSLFLLPVWKTLGNLTSWLGPYPVPKTILALLAVATAVAALILIPADFEIAARGKLQPVWRFDVFARLDGDVIRVPVRHGQEIRKGDLLAELKNASMEEELAKLLGRQTVNQQQVNSLLRAQLDSSRTGPARMTPTEENRLEGDLMQYRQEAENIQRELALFREKQKRLQVLADEPGQVITWKVEETLLRRPVQRGQALMTIANPAGPWELELYVPERRLCHVLGAANETDKTTKERELLEVSFMLHGHPGEEFRGKIVEIEKGAQVRGEEGNTVLVRVEFDRATLPHLHDQTTVTARVYCGRRSLGYTWFCDLIETVQTKVLFWL